MSCLLYCFVLVLLFACSGHGNKVTVDITGLQNSFLRYYFNQSSSFQLTKLPKYGTLSIAYESDTRVGIGYMFKQNDTLLYSPLLNYYNKIGLDDPALYLPDLIELLLLESNDTMEIQYWVVSYTLFPTSSPHHVENTKGPLSDITVSILTGTMIVVLLLGMFILACEFYKKQRPSDLFGTMDEPTEDRMEVRESSVSTKSTWD